MVLDTKNSSGYIQQSASRLLPVYVRAGMATICGMTEIKEDIARSVNLDLEHNQAKLGLWRDDN